jgi:hypothetical protein
LFEFDFMFEFELMFEFECIVFAEFDVLVVAVFETVVVPPVVVVAVFETDVVEAEFDVIVFALFAVFDVFAVSPPHAMPKAARPKSAESAIALFIVKTISCLLQRLILDSLPKGRLAPNSFYFGTNEMILR